MDCFAALAMTRLSFARSITAIRSDTMTSQVMDCRRPEFNPPRAGLPAPAATSPGAPARARYPRHIREWCGRYATPRTIRRGWLMRPRCSSQLASTASRSPSVTASISTCGRSRWQRTPLAGRCCWPTLPPATICHKRVAYPRRSSSSICSPLRRRYQPRCAAPGRHSRARPGRRCRTICSAPGGTGSTCFETTPSASCSLTSPEPAV